MANFSEVIRQRDRMCEASFCESCPVNVYKAPTPYACGLFLSEHPEEYEAIVMKWAKEHPAMTNRQKLGEIMKGVFDDELIEGFKKEIGNCTGFRCEGRSCTECKDSDFWNEEYQPPKEANNE